MRVNVRNRMIRRGATVLAVVAALAPVAPAVAVTPSKTAAVAAAKAKAATLARQTHASSYRVLGCRKSTSVRYQCQIENRFKSGARRCTADVIVTFKAGRTRTSYSHYTCF